MSITRLGLLAFALTVGPAGSSAGAQTQCADESTAAAADSLAAKFNDHQFVFIGSTHGDLKIENFLACVITRPAFTGRATDIVVEWAGSGHQSMLDRYVLALEPIPADSLALLFLDTDQPILWATLPQTRQFVEVLRSVNKRSPREKRIRLIGGNEGIDWNKVKVPEDLAPYPYKTNLMPHLLVEHLAKEPGNRTLVVYGDCHIHWKGKNFMGDLEQTLGRPKLFVVGRIGELTPSERPSLLTVGNTDKPFFVSANRFPRDTRSLSSLRVCRNETSERLADYMDAFVYLGPAPDTSLVGSIALTAEQKRELDRRSSILSDPQRFMRARYQGKPRWFSGHPQELPSR